MVPSICGATDPAVAQDAAADLRARSLRRSPCNGTSRALRPGVTCTDGLAAVLHAAHASASETTGGLLMDEYKGHLATVVLTDDTLVIQRGKLSSPGLDKERRIPLGAIAAVRMRDATFMENGWLQISVGTAKPSLNFTAAASDNDTVFFRRSQRSAFRALRDRIDEIIADNQERGVDPSAVPVAATVAEQRAEAAEARREELAQRYEREVVRPDIAAAASRMKWTLGGNRELKKLHEHLYEDETVQFIAQGTYQTRQGIIVLTDARLVFLFHGIMGQILEDFPLGNITSVSSSAGPVTGKMIVHSAGNDAVISGILKADVQPLIAAVRAQVAQIGQDAPRVPAQQQAPANETIAMEQLERLGALHRAGVLNDEEFESKKAELLKRI